MLLHAWKKNKLSTLKGHDFIAYSQTFKASYLSRGQWIGGRGGRLRGAKHPGTGQGQLVVAVCSIQFLLNDEHFTGELWATLGCAGLSGPFI